MSNLAQNTLLDFFEPKIDEQVLKIGVEGCSFAALLLRYYFEFRIK